MSRPTIDVDELTPELRKQLGLRRRPQRSLSKNDVRTYAIRVLNVIADLTPAERSRVLKQAAAVNDV
jgi:hypothetical protein